MRAPTLFSYLSEEEGSALCKLAEEDSPAKRKMRAMGPLLAGVAGMGTGTLAGFGAVQLANKAYKHFAGKNIPAAVLLAGAPIVGGGLGLAYNLAQAHQMEAMRRELEGADNKSDRRVP